MMGCTQHVTSAVHQLKFVRIYDTSMIASSSRCFGTTRVVQKRRHMMKLLHPKQLPYKPKPDGYSPLPLSLLGSGPIRRLIYSNTQQAVETAATVDWSKYKCDVKGVRWHPSGSWRVQFDRRNYEHNFFVKCDCYFRVSLYGFTKAKQLAIAYRHRLQREWEELEETWKTLDWEKWLKKRGVHQNELTLKC